MRGGFRTVRVPVPSSIRQAPQPSTPKLVPTVPAMPTAGPRPPRQFFFAATSSAPCVAIR